MSEAEMAEGGPSPAGTVKSRLHSARNRLSRLLRSEFRAEEARAVWKLPGRAGTVPDSPKARRDHD